MIDISFKEDVQILMMKDQYSSIIVPSLIGVVAVVLLRWLLTRRFESRKTEIPGKLGLPLLGETFSFLAAANSTRGCYDFVRQRRLRYAFFSYLCLLHGHDITVKLNISNKSKRIREFEPILPILRYLSFIAQIKCNMRK